MIDMVAQTPNPMYIAYREYAEGGYADRWTVLQGQTIKFHVGNVLESFSAKIVRMIGDSGDYSRSQDVLTLGTLHGTSPEFGGTAERGCEWELTCALTIPESWPSGWYRLEFPVQYARESRYVDFIVAEQEPSAPILFIFDMQTAQAYNVYGGGSFYGVFDETGAWTAERQLHQISFRRPLVRSHTYKVSAPRIVPPIWIPHEEETFRLWLESRFHVAYLSNDALETVDENYLAQYPLIVIVGQQEYWSNRQVRKIQDYVRQGGNLYLSATEFAYAAIRYDTEHDVLNYYYDPRDDPILAVDPSNVATVRGAISDEIEDFFGVSLKVGEGLGISPDFVPLRVVNPESRIFRALGYSEGDALASVRGLGVGAWTAQQENGKYTITSSRIPEDQVDVLALAHYPPLAPRQRGHPEHTHENFDHTLTDYLIDGRIDHTSTTIPETTCAVVALIRQGKGEMFVAPGGWFNSPHPHNTDPRVPKMIEIVIGTLSQRGRE